MELYPGDKVIKKLLPAEIVKKNAAPKKKMGGFNPMAGIMDEYERMEKSYTFKENI